jgi:catechol 2,3-dioxygenase-like lactoylglutathione lyase family enzyme
MVSPPAHSVRVSHVAIAVSDLDASTRFYTGGLGFEASASWESGDEVAEVSEVEPPVKMRSRYLTKDGFRLELMEWETPAVHGIASPYRNQRGLTHLSFEVDDAAKTEASLLELGGVALPRARVYIDRPHAGFSIVFLTDPDGTRIELLQRHPKSG